MIKKTISSLLLITGANILFALPALVGSTQYKASSVNSLSFNLRWENLEIEPADTNEITVDIHCNNRRYAPTVKLSSGSLIIESVPLKRVIFMSNNNCTVIVKMPQNMTFEKIKLHTSSGNIKSSVKITSNESLIEASSGNIQIKDLNSKTAKVQASSGNISLNNFTVTDLISQASSGRITLNNIISQSLQSQTSSGAIKLQDISAKTFESHASSGNITGQNLACQSFNISTSSGTIGLEFVEAPSSKSIIQSTSGTQYISIPEYSKLDLRVTTSSGRFLNTITNEKISSHADYKEEINGGGPLLSLTSSSASITLEGGNFVEGRSTSDFSSQSEDIPVVIFDDAK